MANSEHSADVPFADAVIENWKEEGRKAYADAQPQHAAPSAEPYRSLWLEGWSEAHEKAGLETVPVIQGLPVKLKKIKGKIYLTTLNDEVIGEQAHIGMEGDRSSLKWTAQITFLELTLDD